MNTARPEITLGDYLRTIGRHWRMIVAIGVFCGAGGLAISLVMQRTYSAQAALAVSDPSSGLALLGAPYASAQTPLQLALAHVPEVTRPAVVRKAQRSIHFPLTPNGLKEAVAVSVDPNSALVLVSAHAPNAFEAAAIANAVAQADEALTNAATRAAYAREAKQLSSRLKQTGKIADPATRAIDLEQVSRLQSLSSVATPVQVTSPAQVPGSASSPKPVRNVIAALIFGLLFGVALAYGREKFDRRLRQPSDVQLCLPHPVVGHVRAGALGHVFAHLNGHPNGANELSAIDEESFRILRHNVNYLAPGDELRTILVTSPMAQEGKSTVAACLAAASAAAGKRTLLVDCDLRRPMLAERFGLKLSPGLTDYLTGNTAPQDILQSVEVIAGESGVGRGIAGAGNGNLPATGSERLVCITSGQTAPRPTELLASDRFQAFLAEVSRVYESVILDSAPLLPVADSLEIVPYVDGVLICVRLEQTTRDQARAANTALERMPPRSTAVVVTAIDERDEGYYGYYGYYGASTPTASGAAR